MQCTSGTASINYVFFHIFGISGEPKKYSVVDLSGRMIKMKLDPTSVQGNVLHKSLKQDSIPVKCVLPTRPPYWGEGVESLVTYPL